MGTDAYNLIMAADNITIADGITSGASIAGSYNYTALGASAQGQYNTTYQSYLASHNQTNLTVAGYFAASNSGNRATTAWTPYGGGVIYIDPKYFQSGVSGSNQALLLHEMLHETGVEDDMGAMKALQQYDPSANIDPNGTTDQITRWLNNNCIGGPGNN
jgi:hypothetical protein